MPALHGLTSLAPIVPVVAALWTRAAMTHGGHAYQDRWGSLHPKAGLESDPDGLLKD